MYLCTYVLYVNGRLDDHYSPLHSRMSRSVVIAAPRPTNGN